MVIVPMKKCDLLQMGGGGSGCWGNMVKGFYVLSSADEVIAKRVKCLHTPLMNGKGTEAQAGDFER